jgi:hypothetical protein
MGGILAVARVDGFLSNLQKLRRAVDADTADWTRLVARWVTQFGTRAVGASDLIALVEDKSDPIALQLGGGDDASRRTKLGTRLVEKRGCVFGAYQITEAGKVHHALQWRLQLIHTGSDEYRAPTEVPRDGEPDSRGRGS